MLDQDQADLVAAQYAEEEAKWMETVVAEWRDGVKSAVKAAGEWQAFGDQMARLAEWPAQMLPGLPPSDPGDFEGSSTRIAHRIPDFGLPANALAEMFTSAMHTAYSVAGTYRRHIAQLTRALADEKRAHSTTETAESDV